MIRTSWKALLCTAAGAAAAGAQPVTDAEYVVRFDATWSAQTHPQSFPPGPHFSPIVGATHGDQVTFWEIGGLATPGIESMAETGATSVLVGEVDTAIGAGSAGSVILGGGIAVSPGSVAQSFTITPDHPLVTLVSMVAPSPDWFVGVTGLSLVESGDWVESVTVTLWPFDAGTDSGTSYTSPNQNTAPQVPITQITSGPLGNGVPLGTFTFTRVTVGIGDELPSPVAAGLFRVGPNPARGPVTVRWRLDRDDRVSVAVFDVRGRQVRGLRDELTAAGDGEVIWDGRGTGGSRVRAGVYFVRLSAGELTRVRQVVISE